MGLVANTEKRKTYLSVAAGNIWNKKLGKEDPNYAEEEYTDSKGETQIRKGARYKILTGRVTGVEFRQHPQYGESMAVSINDDGDDFILSISTNNHYSQSMLKALLIMDVERDIYIRPYDITENGKRNRGISFRQDGVKLDFTTIVRPSEFEKERSFFKGGDPKMIKRFFEDLTDWYIGQVKEKVVPKLDSIVPSVQAPKSTPKAVEDVVVKQDAEAPKDVAKPSVIKMKKFIKSYIEENYEGETLPKLSKEEVGVWYDLALADEELPFKDEDEVSQGDLDSELSALLG
jgi:hypothetical protein